MFKIGPSIIGQENKPFIIAEVAQAHDGSLGFAHSFIDAAAESGADAIKFQTHIAHAESTKDESFRIPMSGQDETRYDYWKRMEFAEEQWAGLFKHAEEKNIVLLSSAFSVEAVHLLKKFNMPAYKIGSGEFKSNELIEAMLETGMPILFSTGMSTYEEVAEIADTLKHRDTSFALFQCTSNYPTKLEHVGINVLDEYATAHGCPVGLSDHSGTPYPSLMAMARGASLIEVHVTFDRRMYGPDAVASITFDELSMLCKARDAFHVIKQNPVDKDQMADRMQQMRNLFTKSIALVEDQIAGTILTSDILTPKKPGTGIPYSDRGKVIGKRLTQNVPADRLLKKEDFE
ncbi:MAG: N-acetylneuraminate synthase [Micavibrio aeruginosavorus]|uniref:N-acetylneuraminate synthase n=1 Tax=Micavibrio aeruginosavorus TaxID=349221 RepID=A0A2W5HIW9_9BACT|nr:MAG: N-acetylneuraminate synthase [Micavibrio aeruginosavorus]